MPPAYEILLLNTAVPQIQAAQAGDTYVVPRDIAFSAALTLSAGTANGVPYLNGSKVLTSGSALTFDGLTFGVSSDSGTAQTLFLNNNDQVVGPNQTARLVLRELGGDKAQFANYRDGSGKTEIVGNAFLSFALGTPTAISEQMQLTSTGLIAQQGAVFNESGADSDFRVESDTNTHALFVKGSSGNVGIGTSSPAAVLDVRGSAYVIGAGGTRTTDTANGNGFEVIPSTTNNILSYNRTSNTYLPIRWRALDQTFEVDNVNKFKLSSTEAVFNDPGNDYDFRVESDTNTHALFVQGSDGFVGIGTSSPLDRLDVVSSGGTYRNRIRNSTTAEAILLFQNSTTGTTSTDGLFVGIVSGTDAYLWQYENASLIFGSNNTERLRIKSTGQTRFVPLAADPAGAEAGDVYYNSGTNKLRLYDGTSWVDLN